MTMNSHHKLYDFEVMPPAEAWNRIAKELDEISEYRNISTKLSGLEIAAPPLAWENISNELSELQSFNKIAEKLRAVEVAPPAAAWTHIETALAETTPKGKVIPMQATKRSWVKYAVAATIIGLLGTMAYYLSLRSSKEAETIMASIEDSKKEPVAGSDNATVVTNNNNNISNPANTVAPKPNSGLAAGSSLRTLEKRTPKSGNTYATTVEKNREIQGRYIVLMTENGDVVRMSKKLGNMADCIAGEDPSADCNSQIAMWQEEIAKLPVASTPDNFLEILELANKPTGL